MSVMLTFFLGLLRSCLVYWLLDAATLLSLSSGWSCVFLSTHNPEGCTNIWLRLGVSAAMFPWERFIRQERLVTAIEMIDI